MMKLSVGIDKALAQQLSGLGLDTAAQLGYNMGQPIGAWASQLVEDTHLAPGTSAWDYFGDKFKSGAAGNLESAGEAAVFDVAKDQQIHARKITTYRTPVYISEKAPLRLVKYEGTGEKDGD